MLKNLTTGLIYRNPSPHLKSIHAYFPSVAVLPNGEMIATVVLGEAFEAVNLRTHIMRSHDSGETWHHSGPVYSGSGDRLMSDFSRISVMPDGELILLMSRSDRTDHPGEGLTNPDTLGFVPAEFLIFRSVDNGNSWSEPSAIDSPLGDTPLELCCPVTPLGDGRCIIPTSTWNKWDGDNTADYRMIALVSTDSCKSWPEYVDVMADPEQSHRFWESKVIELDDGRLCAAAWKYNHAGGCDCPNHYALSYDGGKSWSEPESTGLRGQTLTPFLLSDGRILSVYRRMDISGLWANVSRIEGTVWINRESVPLWGHQSSGFTGTDANMAENFRVLRFGAPCISQLADGVLFTAFWAYEDNVSNIRWFKFNIELFE